MSEPVPEIYQNIIDRHEQVRQMVEETYPSHHVIHVKESAETHYAATLETQDQLNPTYILTLAEVVFDVEALYMGHKRMVRVYIQENATLSYVIQQR